MAKIFSIKRKYCEKIFSKEKLVEFRRQNVRILQNEKCLIYTTSPVKRITGYFVVKEKIRLPLKRLWELTKEFAGITKNEFMKYFKGCLEGTAILIKYVKKFIDGITLDEIKSLFYNFKPPQSYYNLDIKSYNIILKELGYPRLSLSDF